MLIIFCQTVSSVTSQWFSDQGADDSVRADKPGTAEELADAQHLDLQSLVTVDNALHGRAVLINVSGDRTLEIFVVAFLDENFLDKLDELLSNRLICQPCHVFSGR